MKRYFLTAALCAAMLLTSCGSSYGGTELTKHIKPQQITALDGTAEFSDAQMQFAVSLLHQAADSAEGNLLLSPYLAAEAWLTAAGGTAAEFPAELFGGMNADQLNGYFAGWRGSQNGLTEAQALWVSPDTEMPMDALGLYLGLSNTRIFAAERTADMLNQWISDVTGGVMKQISVPENGDAALVSAASFDVKWNSVYNNNEVQNALFYCADGRQKSVPFLCKDYDTGVYFDDDAVTGLRRNCADRKYTFLALMPKSGTVSDLLKSLTPEQLTAYIRGGSEITLRTVIPCVKLSDTENIAEFLPDAGIGQMIQQVQVIIDRGTEESSFGLQMDSSAAKPAEKAAFNHPFVYFIADRQYGLPLIAGTVTELPVS